MGVIPLAVLKGEYNVEISIILKKNFQNLEKIMGRDFFLPMSLRCWDMRR